MSPAAAGRLRRVAGHPRAPGIVLGAFAAAAALWHLHLARGMVVFGDELGWAQRYRHLGSGVLELWGGWFDPLARLTYNAVFATAGLREQWPLALMAVGANVALVVAVHLYCRHLGRPWTGVLLGAVLLVMGPAYYSLLWPLNSLNALGLAVMPACLILLARDTRRDDLLALGALLVGIGFAGPVVVALCPGIAVWLLMSDPRSRRRLLVPGIPVAVYAVAYLTLPGFSADQALRTNLRLAPGHVVETGAATAQALAGALDTVSTSRPTALGGALLALAVIALVALWPRLDAPARARVAAWGAVAATEWAFIAIARANLGAPGSSRYIILGAVPVLLIAVDLARVAPRRAVWGAGALLAVAGVVNALMLHQAGAPQLRAISDQARAELGAVELTMDTLPAPGTIVSVPLLYLVTDQWRTARERLGPTYALTADELARATPEQRAAADRALLSIGALSLPVLPAGDAPAGGVCGPAEGDRPLAPGATLVVRPSAGAVTVTPRRFGDAGPPERAATVAPGSALIVSAVDDAGPPWRLAFDAPAEVCIR